MLTGFAKKIWEMKYRDADTNETKFADSSLRVAKAIASVETKDTYKELYTEIFFNYINSQEWIPGGRITAGAGTKNRHLNNCYVIEIKDSVEDIYEQIKRTALISKTGGGVGLNISTLRPKGALLKTGGDSSGAVSWLKVFDASCGVIKNAGGRRAALIGVLNIDHPDIEEFIDAKREEGNLTNFNLSIGITNDFINAVKNNEDWDLKFNNKVYKTVSAVELFNKICYSAWMYNDPGLFMLDNVNRMNNGYYITSINCPNPCFTGDTKILTQDGYVRLDTLSNINNGECFIINKDGVKSNGKVWSNGYKNIIELIFNNKNQKNIKCTPDHVFMLTDGSECEAKDLYGKRIMPYFSIKNNFDRIPFLAGFIQGDGNTSRLLSDNHSGLEINIGNNDQELSSMFNIPFSGRISYSKEWRDIALSYNLSSNTLPTRDMPEYKWDSQVELSNFLSGLFSANGCVIKGKRIAFKTTCKNLAIQLQDILENIYNIDSYITINKSKPIEFNNGIYTCRESYDLNITRYHSILKFANFISFAHQYKQDALCELIKLKAPIVTKIEDAGACEVFDFNEPITNWGVIEGVIAHNCGELPLFPSTSCDLCNLNITKYVMNPFTPDAKIDMERFKESVYNMVRFLDNVIDYSDYPLKDIQVNMSKYRRIGLNPIAGIGSALAMLGLPYDSDKGREIVGELFRTARDTAYHASCDLACEKGCFPLYDEKYLHSNFIMQLPDYIIEKIQSNGIRNIAILTVPPVGTGSLLAGNISNGLEPIFSLEYNRNVKQLDGSIKVEKVEDYAWKIYKKIHNVNDESFKKPDFFKTSMEIDPKSHVDMMAVVAKYNDGAASKTVNMPEDYSLDEYKKLLMYAIDSGLMGFTSYRAGTRDAVLFETKDEPKCTKTIDQLVDEKLIKRPTVLDGKTYRLKEDEAEHKTYCTVNYNNIDGVKTPWEMFLFSSSKNHEWYAAIGRLASKLMRRTGNVQEVIDELKAIKGDNGFLTKEYGYVYSRPYYLACVLEDFASSIGDKVVEVLADKCPKCGENTLIREGGCARCNSCGYDKCGG